MKHVKPFLIMCALAAFLLCLALPAYASEDPESCAMKQEIKDLKEKIDKIEKENAASKEDLHDLNSRVDKTELHTATDKISFSAYLRTRADSIHYEDTRVASPSMVQAFFTPPPYGFNGATLSQIQQAIGNMAMAGMIPPAEKYDANNDIIYTNKFRLDMKGTINSQLSFMGRLAAYKVFGDSTGVKFNQGSLGDVTFDGNTSSLPHGDTLRLERAYFSYRQDLGRVPMTFSLGRRPSTDGPPLEYGNYTEVGGSPLATIINWQFDGASLTFGLDDVTGIPGESFKLCYGVGYESDYGNSSSLTDTQSDLQDVHMLGFISDLYNNGTTNLMLNYAHAWNITDGFTGLTVMPFIVSKTDANGDGVYEYNFSQNNGGFISRMEPSTNIGDWDAASLLLRTNLKEQLDSDIDCFLAGSWTHTDPSQISKNPFYEIMGMGLLSSNGHLESRNGYSIYTGALFPMPLKARLGLEYNWGSKYWFNFTGAEDSLVGSKLAARGQVYEGYYIQPIFGRNFFIKGGAQFYDYAYTGSGNPLGAPVKISDATALDALFPVVDKVWNYYLGATVQF
jgi:hypothetical protein